MPKSWALVTLMAVLAGAICPASVRGAEIRRVRMGTHPQFSRVVIEVSAPFRFTLGSLPGQRVLVSFPGSRLAAKLVIQRWSDARIKRISRSGARGLVLALAPGRYRVKRFRLDKPHRLVLDVYLPARSPGPPLKPARPAAAASKPSKPSKKPAKPARPKPRPRSAAKPAPARTAPATPQRPSWTLVKSIQLLSRRGLSRLVMTLSARALSSLQREGDRVTLTLRGVRLAPGVDVAGLSDALVPGVSTQDNGKGTVYIRFSLARSDLSVDSSFIPSENRLVIDVLRAGVAATKGLRARLARLAPWPDDKLGPAPRPGLWPTFPSVVDTAAARVLMAVSPGPPVRKTARRRPRPAAAPGAKPATGPPPVTGPESGMIRRAAQALKLGLPHRAFILYDRVRDQVEKRRPRDYQDDPAFEAATFGRAAAFWRMHRKSKNLPLLASQVAEKFQEAMNRYPKSPRYPWALILLGRLNQATGDFHEALGYYELVIREHAKSHYAPLAYLGRAQILIRTRREEEATKVYQKVISLYPDSPYLRRAYWGLGKTMLDIGRYDYARSVFVTMLQKWPGIYLKRPEILYYLGESYFLLRQYGQARHNLYWALNIKPNLAYNHIALARIGDTYKFDNDPAAAKQIYRRVIALYPGTDGAIISRIRLVEMGVGGDPVRVYRGIMRRYRRREVAQLAQLKLGTYYFSRKQYRRATATLNDLLSNHPKSRFREPAVYVLQKVLHERAMALDRQKRYRALVDFLTENRARLSPRRRRTYLSLEAKAHLHLQQYDQAYDLFHRLYLYGDTSQNVILGLVGSSLGRSDYPRALAAIDEFLRRFQNQPQAEELAFRRGFILERLGKKAAALKALAQALKLFPNSKWRGQALAALGLILVGQDRCPKAVDYLERAAKVLAAGGPAKKGPRRHLRFLVYSDLGSCYFQAGRHPLAIRATRAAIKLSPDATTRWQLTYQLVKSYFELNLPNTALALLRKMAKGKDRLWSRLARERLAERQLWRRAEQLGVDVR